MDKVDPPPDPRPTSAERAIPQHADHPRRRADRQGIDRHRVQGAQRRRPAAAGDTRQGPARSPARSATGRTTSRRACIARESRTIGIISNDSFGRFTFPIVEALEERLADEGIAVFMCNATDDPARERQHLDQLMGKRVDGLVVSARRADKRLPIGPFAHGLPVVYVVQPGRRSRRASACCRMTKAAPCSRWSI